MKLLLLGLLAVSLFASEEPVNKSQLCEMYYASFITSLDAYADSNSCLDVQYGILSFKELLLSECDIDQEDIDIAEAYNKEYLKCKN